MTLRLPVVCVALALAVTAHAQQFKCPANRGSSLLVSADVYDGPPAEMVQLVPDDSTGTMSYTYASWNLEYLFDMGHTPFLVCKFAGLPDTEKTIIKIDQKVQKCVFKAKSGDRPAEAECK
jgi:hypothetical protein